MRSITLISMLLSLSITLTACVNVKPLYPERFDLTERQREIIEQSKSKAGFRAVALSANGKNISSRIGDSYDDVIRRSLSLCQINAQTVCHLMSLGTQDFQTRYQAFNNESERAIRSLRMPNVDLQAYENTDWQIEEPEQIRSVNEGIHFATPTSLRGVKNITTAELVAGIKEDKYVLIDASNLVLDNGKTIPSAHVIDWIGVAYATKSDAIGADTYSVAALEGVMNSLAPAKDQAIVVFCTSPECWLSVNGLMRLRSLGYTNLYWYRGGLDVWRSSDLPMVKQVPYASVRYYESSQTKAPIKAN